jgi:hypothetical protein
LSRVSRSASSRTRGESERAARKYGANAPGASWLSGTPAPGRAASVREYARYRAPENSGMAARRSAALKELTRYMRRPSSPDHRASTSTAVYAPAGGGGISTAIGWSRAKATAWTSATTSMSCSMAPAIAALRPGGGPGACGLART